MLPLLCLTIAVSVNGQSRRIRIRPRPIQPQPEQESDIDAQINEEDNTPQPAIQYYTASHAQENEDQGRIVLVASDDEYNGVYGRPTPAAPRARADYIRPIAKSSTASPRTKESVTKEPPVQTIRNYSKVNDDGSFTFGYEAADGSFKEETRGTDCVVRGKYGYVDPDGNKREFTYVSGNPCDPNNPDQTEEDEKEEESNEPENVPANFPRRPSARPIQQRPVHTTTQQPTTVFQNQFSSASYNDEDEESEGHEQEQPEPIQLLQQRPRVSSRPQHIQAAAPEEVAIRQRPRITYLNTTPSPLYTAQTQPASHPVSITPRPSYRIQAQSVQTQPPATTYRPSVQFFTQKPAQISYSKPGPSHLAVEPITKTAYASTRKPIDFTAELAKFQQEHNAITTTTPRISTLKVYKQPAIQKLPAPTPSGQPIYQTQLVFDPSTGQYESSLVPQGGIQGDAGFQRVHPSYHHQQQYEQPQQQVVSLEQLQQQNHQPLYQRPQIQSTRAPLQFPQFSQQVYQKENENLQVLNSQQLFAQQQQLQQQQLHQDRLEASKRLQQNHRFQLAQSQAAPIRQLPAQQHHPGFYYVQHQNPSLYS